MAKDDVISERVRLLLDAAREDFEVTIEWVERGDPRCNGRDFGYWKVLVGPAGWTSMPVPPHEGFGKLRGREQRMRQGVIMEPMGVEWHDLGESLEQSIDAARKRWPNVDWPW